VIKLSALGDMILAFAAFARIRAAHPEARITLLTTPPFEALARASPYFDAVDPGGRPEGLRELAALVLRLRRARFARVYDLQDVDRTNLYFQLLRPFPPAWSGTAWGCALPHRNPARMRLHTLERHAEQLNDAGLAPPEPVAHGRAAAPDVSWLAEAAPPFETSPGRLALLVPGAAPSRPRKLWPARSYGILARGLLEAGFAVRVLGGADATGIAEVIAQAAPEAEDLTGRTSLAQVARLGAAAAVAVGNDTGPMHLIAAAGAPCVSLFSDDSDPALCAPRGRVTVLRRSDLAELPTERVLEAAQAAADRCDAAKS
jgi:ADP-heptose:LPS heptosyltransferase